MRTDSTGWTRRTNRLASWAASAVLLAPTMTPLAHGDSPATQSVQRDSASALQVRPRFTLEVPSVNRLISETKRSHAGVFQTQLADLVMQAMARPADADADSFDREELQNALDSVKNWPDTSVQAALYAPDREGKSRWTVELDWAMDDLLARFDALKKSDLGEGIFADAVLRRCGEDAYELVLQSASLATIRAIENRTLISSHRELRPPIRDQKEPAETDNASDEAFVLKCRLHLTGTEQDSGSTFLSKFNVITGADYSTQVDESGNWVDSLKVHWPPITGTGAKMLIGRVRQTFYVPGDAFGAVVFNSMMVPGALEGIAGFGPQLMMTKPGKAEIVGEVRTGPILRHGSATICVTFLPGTGFFPMPDIVVQSRAKSPEFFEKNTRKAIDRINKTFRDREQSEPWHETTVRDRAVFWREGSGAYPGMVMPLVLRPVLFVNEEKDAKGRDRNFLVVAWTSTSPEDLVRRWLDKPRTKDHTYLPARRKTNGQLWVHWKQVYKWIHPYLNVALSGSGVDLLLPYADEIESDLDSAMLTSKVSYTGFTLSHNGPFPLGVLAVPALFGIATGVDASGSTDLSRERLASRRLLVLYHHSKLFKKDHQRWPAEVAELDGYVDFAGHPELLKLKLSSKQQWGEWFKGLLGWDEKEEETDDEEEDVTSDIDDDLYVIDWGRTSWRLGYAPETLLHLKELYIDQDGKIHRELKKDSLKDDEEKDPRAEATDIDAGEILEQAASNIHKRYPLRADPKKKKE